MITTFMITLCVLAIALYVQARAAAREIRRHRSQGTAAAERRLVLK